MITLNLAPRNPDLPLEPSISAFTLGYRQALNALRLIGRIAQLRALDKRRAALPSIMAKHVHVPLEAQVTMEAPAFPLFPIERSNPDPTPCPSCPPRPRLTIIRRRKRSIG